MKSNNALTRGTRWHARILVLVTSFAALNTGAAEPEKTFPPWDRAGLGLGGHFATFDSSLSLAVKGAAGVGIDAEDLLGLESSLFVFYADGFYRLGQSKRHQVGLSYSAYHRSGNGTLTQEIQIGDTVLLPGTQLDTVFNFDIIRTSYSYAIFQDERIRIGLGWGVYIPPIKYSITLESPGENQSFSAADITVPLPAISLQSELRILPKLSLIGGVDAMYLKISSFEGSLLSANLALEYRPWQHFGLGLAYNAMSVNVESTSSSNKYPGADFVGAINVDYGGVVLYAKLAF